MLLEAPMQESEFKNKWPGVSLSGLCIKESSGPVPQTLTWLPLGCLHVPSLSLSLCNQAAADFPLSSSSRLKCVGRGRWGEARDPLPPGTEKVAEKTSSHTATMSTGALSGEGGGGVGGDEMVQIPS